MNVDQAAAAALAELLPAKPSATATAPADQRLREFFRGHPKLGKRDRQQVGDLVFDVLRNLRLYEALAGQGVGQEDMAAPEAPMAKRIARSQLPGVAKQAEIARKAAVALAAQERARSLVGVARLVGREAPVDLSRQVATTTLPSTAGLLPAAVRYSLPDWLWERLQASHGERAQAIAAALLQTSPIDIRANLLLGKSDELARRLREQGVETAPIAGVPTGLRIIGRPNLEKLDLFERGWFEIQDAGSQRIVDFCAPRRGQLVVDFCAGSGGKTLAMAARMRNAGKVLAFDTGDERLSRLMPRARRAGVGIVEPMRVDGVADARLGRYRRRADLVLVDAPCSGTGTLRRSPDMKWRLTPQRLLQHIAEQRAILAAASELVKPGGTLVYATCSLLREENEEQVAEFHRAGFELTDCRSWLPDEAPSSGFFVAKWVLQARH
jgi:16S rRNA (cytosine967-C5)-methyltransferase